LVSPDHLATADEEHRALILSRVPLATVEEIVLCEAAAGQRRRWVWIRCVRRAGCEGDRENHGEKKARSGGGFHGFGITRTRRIHAEFWFRSTEIRTTDFPTERPRGSPAPRTCWRGRERRRCSNRA